MWRPISERAAGPWSWPWRRLALAAVNGWWVATYRHGYPFDVDEAGYTTFAVVEYLGLKNGGLHAWWTAVQNQATDRAAR